MIIITSATYIDGELASEFGRIPPSYLPLGNKRLFEHQINQILLSGETDIYLSLPFDYEITVSDQYYFEKNAITIIKVPVDLSLGESIAFCWASFEGRYSQLRILHGDTLFIDSNFECGNTIYVSDNKGYYERAVITKNNNKISIENKLSPEKELIIAGYFSFELGHKFIKFLHKNKFDFINAINIYAAEIKLNLIKNLNWLDFGHTSSYFQSRAMVTTQRSFNDLKITSAQVIKSSYKKNKMFGEYSWFRDIPNELKIFSPNVYWYEDESNSSSYSIEYIYASSLADLFVFGRHETETWQHIFYKVKFFLSQAKNYSPNFIQQYEKYDDLYLSKTLARLELFSNETDFDINKEVVINGKVFPSILDIVNITANYIRKTSVKDICVTHGDLCFSNILYNFRSQSIKLIDPRGIDVDGKSTIYGDQRYDLAKFAHSVIGLYDYIIAKKYTIKKISSKYEYIFELRFPRGYSELINCFQEVFTNGDLDYMKQLMAIVIHLFFSMLPLHSDDYDRQMALMLNAFRIFDDYFNKGVK